MPWQVCSFVARLADANRALSTLTYRGDTDFFGRDAVIISAEDLGNSGQGPLCAGQGVCNLADTMTIPLWVSPAVDPLMLAGPVEEVLLVDEDHDLLLDGLSMQVGLGNTVYTHCRRYPMSKSFSNS